MPLLRAFVAAALAAVLLSSCAWGGPLQTQQLYAPSDGVRFELGEDVRAENLFVLSEGGGAAAQLMGALVNNSGAAVTVGIGIEGTTLEVVVPAQGVAQLHELDPLPSFRPLPGQTAGITLTHRGTISGTVPVLDGTLPPYDEYLP